MENKLVIKEIDNNSHRITIKYDVTGEWVNYFRPENDFYVEYDIDISTVPDSIAVIPFLTNILPIAWICDATISIPECDKSFYDSITEFKKGYADMYPMIDFKGVLDVKSIVDNKTQNASGSLLFFSGGVDAYNSLISHWDEKPVLMTVYGSDIKVGNETAWLKVANYIDDISREYDLNRIFIKSQFRKFINEGELSRLVSNSGDGWWHGFQHGIGLIGHSAPIAYVLNKKTVYIASTFTLEQIKSKTCASSPTIDNFVKFASADVIHDGVEFNRQDKARRIVNYQRETNKNIVLRVCWESDKGTNCCHCEKCWRTIMEIYSEKGNPKDFGFDYPDFSALCKEIYQNKAKLKRFSYYWGAQIMPALRKNYTMKELEPNLKWLYKSNPKRIGEEPIWKEFINASVIKTKVFVYNTLTMAGIKLR